jgi:hypothetical protein
VRRTPFESSGQPTCILPRDTCIHPTSPRIQISGAPHLPSPANPPRQDTAKLSLGVVSFRPRTDSATFIPPSQTNNAGLRNYMFPRPRRIAGAQQTLREKIQEGFTRSADSPRRRQHVVEIYVFPKRAIDSEKAQAFPEAWRRKKREVP